MRLPCSAPWVVLGPANHSGPANKYAVAHKPTANPAMPINCSLAPTRPPATHLSHPRLALRVAIQARALRLGPIIHRLHNLCPAGTARTAATAAATFQPLAQAGIVLVQQRGGLWQDVVRVCGGRWGGREWEVWHIRNLCQVSGRSLSNTSHKLAHAALHL